MQSPRPVASLRLRVLGVVVLFLFAIGLLGSTTDALSPILRRVLGRVVTGDASALGVSWVASYVLANGSIVAALSLTLFNAELVTATQLFAMVVGSRLGGAGVVVFLGVADYLNEEMESLSESLRLGLLTFLVTHSVYLPVLALGYVSMPLIRGLEANARAVPELTVPIPNALSILSTGMIDTLGAGVAFLVAIGSILLSMRLFDRLLDTVDKQRLRRRYLSKLNDKWVSFGLGLVFTGLTTSVAFSLGVVVPLYNRGHVKRAEIMPYILGANLGTVADTLIVAVALNTPIGVATVLLVLTAGFITTMVLLAYYTTYGALIDRIQDALLTRPIYFAGFLLSLAVVPLLLVFSPV
jgi:sodium-dependent phosphate cotransporter